MAISGVCDIFGIWQIWDFWQKDWNWGHFWKFLEIFDIFWILGQFLGFWDRTELDRQKLAHGPVFGSCFVCWTYQSKIDQKNWKFEQGSAGFKKGYFVGFVKDVSVKFPPKKLKIWAGLRGIKKRVFCWFCKGCHYY